MRLDEFFPEPAQSLAESLYVNRDRERNAGLERETNNIQIAINGKPWKVIAGKGYADSAQERSYLEAMQRWAEKKSASSGKKWSVYLTGADVSQSTDLGKHSDNFNAGTKN
jgi:hypothetical protein